MLTLINLFNDSLIDFLCTYSTIENNNGKLILSSEMEGDTFVNGQV